MRLTSFDCHVAYSQSHHVFAYVQRLNDANLAQYISLLFVGPSLREPEQALLNLSLFLSSRRSH